jgi:hypothetical protein
MPIIKVTSVSLPADWHEAFEAEAKKRKMTLSEFATWAMKAQLPARAAAKLSERKQRGRPKKSNANKLPPRRMRGEREAK